MKITLDIPDGIICGFFNGVEYKTGVWQAVIANIAMRRD